MSEHFIQNIEIKNFKCFKDFKAEGFGRVNLIGGKNNVGKTAFMEACYLASINIKSKEFIERSIILELHRNGLDFLLLWLSDFTEFKLKHKNKEIYVNTKNKDRNVNIGAYSIDISEMVSSSKRYLPFEKYLSSFYKNGFPPLVTNTSFVSTNSSFNKYLVDLIDEIKLADKEDDLNEVLKSFFNIEKIDNIKKKVMLKKDKEYLLLSEFGDGVKHFLNIILALYLNKGSILYLDEIENGIHYTNLDKLWEIILTISKEQNVQVFATTHSKECIESFNKIQKEIEDKDTYYFEMAKNTKTDEIFMTQIDMEQLEYELRNNERIRGE